MKTLSLKIYWQHIKRYRFAGLALVFGTIGGSILSITIPLYFKKFFDLLTSKDDVSIISQALISVLILIVILEFIEWLLWRMADFFTSYFEASMIRDLSNTCFQVSSSSFFCLF